MGKPKHANPRCCMCGGAGWLDNTDPVHDPVNLDAYARGSATHLILSGRVVACWECFPERGLSTVRVRNDGDPSTWPTGREAGRTISRDVPR